MFRRIMAAGYRIIYDPEALSWHRHRRTGAELQRQLRGDQVAGFAILTRAFLFEGNLDALWQACRWLRRELRSVARALIRRPGAPPLRIILARVSGALAGPWLYLYSCRRMRRG